MLEVEAMYDNSLWVKGISSSANEPCCWRLGVFCAALAGKIELGSQH